VSERFFPDEMPMPAADVHTIGFWEAAAEHRLVVQRCRACGTTRHPPAPRCAACRSGEWAWLDLPGTGTLYTFSIVRQAFVPALADRLPYVVCAVELDEGGGVRMVSNLVGCDPSDAVIGLEVSVVFEQMGPELAVPRFTPQARSARA
jgi:uncharacterized protein